MTLGKADRAGSAVIYVRYAGGSMWPCLQTGDLLVVRPVPTEQLRPGDCIVYRKSDQDSQIVHRIVAVRPEVRTKGDARPVEDDVPIAPSWIVGRVESRTRYGHSGRVSGGFQGVWAGRFYRFAGRLDPASEGRGGRLVRLVQRGMRWTARRLLRSAKISTFGSCDEGVSYLALGRRTLGAYKRSGQEWSIAWPFCMLFDPEILPSPR